VKRWTTGIAVVVLGLSHAPAGADPIRLGVPVAATSEPADEPAATFGTPIALPGAAPPASLGPVIRAQSDDSATRTDSRRPKPSDDPLVGGPVPDDLYKLVTHTTGPTLVQASAEEKYNSGTLTDPLDPPPVRRDPPPTKTEKSQSRWWGSDAWDQATRPCDSCADEHERFESDHAFDCLISPVTSPFTAMDPRSLTELRPIFMYQSIPGNQPYYHGGSIYTYALQGRLAITDRWSVVLNKLGGMTIAPNSGAPAGTETGFTEIWLGPQYTFWRGEDTGTIAAAGLTFQLPIGSSSIYQHTGNLSLVPYATIAQSFGRTSFGTFNVMDTLSYAASTTSARNSYIANNLHLDYDVANLHRIYPLVELNWYYYTTNGNGPPNGFTGLDLMNTGSPTASGYDFFSLAAGLRYKFTEHTQFGFAAEFPLVGNKDLFDYRLTFDMIFRY
jgi:hypothetical protein